MNVRLFLGLLAYSSCLLFISLHTMLYISLALSYLLSIHPAFSNTYVLYFSCTVVKIL
jgi:hypothetical protein